MGLTPLQEQTAKAIINVFETGRARGDYTSVTVAAGDTGHLTYGRAQTTLASGSLYLLVKSYCEAEGAELAGELREYLGRLARRDLSLDRDLTFRGMLREAGHDLVMHDVQDRFFDRVYWAPSSRAATGLGITTALGTTVVYDSFIHGSWRPLRDKTSARHGPSGQIGQHAWVSHYVAERRAWLAHHSNRLLRRTVYRMDALRRLIDAGTWDLDLPLRVRGVLIDDESLMETNPVRASGSEEAEGILLLQTPFMRGDAVRTLQQALVAAGLDLAVDGVFGPETQDAVKIFQQREDLKVDGIVGPATQAALNL